MRVHSHLPEHLRAVVSSGLGELEHVAHVGHAIRAAEAASADDACVAFIGPLLSSQVAETAALLNEAGIAQLAIGATCSALTRDEPGAYGGMPGSLCPTGERTLFRLVPRDTAIARAVVARHPRARLVGDEGDYGRQIAAQLRMAGLQEDPRASLTIYAGLSQGARDLGRRVLGFEGTAEEGFPGRLALPQVAGADWSDRATIAFAPQAEEAARLARSGGPSRESVRRALRSNARFDEYGDTRERRIGVWEFVGPVMRQVDVLEDPGG